MAKKEIGVKIIFDDIEYSDNERDWLWGRFFMSLLELSQKESNENIESI